jgi:hypothetical protein
MPLRAAGCGMDFQKETGGLSFSIIVMTFASNIGIVFFTPNDFYKKKIAVSSLPCW